jgi:rSAM/selenodomain-associated transferase 1
MRRIALFARVPEIGRVKTRLGPALPAGLAARLYQGMLEDALAAVRATAADERFVYWSAGAAPPLVSTLTGRAQSEGDLGDRLAAAFAELLPRAGDRAVICGADTPGLAPGALERALDALEGADLALSRARDGGYSLIAMSRPAPALFRDVEWGGAHVLEQTLTRARELGLRAAALDPLDDVDTAEDLCRLVAWAIGDPGPTAPHTWAALRELGLLPAQQAPAVESQPPTARPGAAAPDGRSS